MGDEEYNPLAQYDDLDAVKQAEIASKQVVSTFVCGRGPSGFLTLCSWTIEKDIRSAGSICE